MIVALFIGIFAFLYCAVYLVGVSTACFLILIVLGITVFLDEIKEKLKKIFKNRR